ncbi:prolyl oligopeptidase family serine peptidase [Tautonia sp. JC769]|uniref:prolyl oligopeptidase family serine peptidase n=1 Tax=Tautonia sp. JC769 TaxID=3232135 RepID=UPI00345883DF
MRSATSSALILGVLGGLAIVGGAGEPARASEEAAFERTSDVIYGRKHGTALTMDVFRPTEEGPGRGVGLIFVVSGGWFSAHEAIALPLIEPFLGRGYTVFAVVHGSQPKFTIPEILGDMHRAVRFIRHHADDYGIDPDRIGIFGGSAGGHLSLMQGTAGTGGNPEASDPVEQASSRVQAVACLFPPTDFLNYGEPGENALGRGILENFKAPFDFHELDATRNVYVPITDEERLLAIGRDISPISHVSPDDPPTLILHGDADKLVPIQQAERFLEALSAQGVETELVVKADAGHGWPDLADDLTSLVDWFDTHLLGADASDRPAGASDRP